MRAGRQARLASIGAGDKSHTFARSTRGLILTGGAAAGKASSAPRSEVSTSAAVAGQAPGRDTNSLPARLIPSVEFTLMAAWIGLVTTPPPWKPLVPPSRSKPSVHWPLAVPATARTSTAASNTPRCSLLLCTIACQIWPASAGNHLSWVPAALDTLGSLHCLGTPTSYTRAKECLQQSVLLIDRITLFVSFVDRVLISTHCSCSLLQSEAPSS